MKGERFLFEQIPELIRMANPQAVVRRPSGQQESEYTRSRLARWPALLWLLGLLVVTGCSTAVWGLRPEYPAVALSGTAFVEVDSLQPTLRWEAFSGPQDRDADKERLLGRIRNVTYDLKIWRAEHNTPGQVVYTRQGLPEPWHRLEEPLEPSTKYFWTIRARLELDGDLRVTEWGVRANPVNPILSRRSPLVPNPAHYRFKTP